jgi:hypothetical protein
VTRRCPKPYKRQYTSHEEAHDAAIADSLQYGNGLFPYRCLCRAWHLTKDHRAQLPTFQPANPERVAALRALSAAAFAHVVTADTRNTATVADRLALRHPDNLTRWRWTLKNLRTDITRQLAARTDDTPANRDWRPRAEAFRDTVDMRLAECQHLRTNTSRSQAA